MNTVSQDANLVPMEVLLRKQLYGRMMNQDPELVEAVKQRLLLNRELELAVRRFPAPIRNQGPGPRYWMHLHSHYAPEGSSPVPPGLNRNILDGRLSALIGLERRGMTSRQERDIYRLMAPVFSDRF